MDAASHVSHSQDLDLQAINTALNRVQAVIEFELDGTILHANDNFLRVIGYTLAEVQGKHHAIFCDPEYVKTAEYGDFWAKLGRGEFDQGEYKRRARDGREVWINASYNPILDADGKPYKVIKFATDITASKRRNADYEGKIDAISKAQAVIEFRLDGTIIRANDNFLTSVGYTLAEIEGKHHRLFCEAEYASSEEYAQFWQKLGKGAFDAGEYKRVTKDGREIWLNATYNPIFDTEGRPFKVVKFANDITALKKRNAEYEGKVSAIGKAQAVIEFDMQGNVLAANDNFLAVMDYDLSDIQGEHHRMFCEPEHCGFCSARREDTGQLCVVENPADLLAVESGTGYRGRYFVLMGRLSPLDGMGPEQLGLPKLIEQLSDGTVRELIIATNPTVEGEATAHYIAELAKARQVKVTRIAHGVPMGGELEYVDGGTLNHAFAGRQLL